MKLQDELILYEYTPVSDGAGGMLPGNLVKVNDQWGNVKALSGFIGMNFQQTYGTQGFSIVIRTDFTFEPDRKYIVAHEGIYGTKYMSIQYMEIDKYYTKLICKSENKLSVQVS